MPGDVGMTYPYPYKTGDGEENVKISNLIVTGTTLLEEEVTINGPTTINNNVTITEDLTVDGSITADTHIAKKFIATDPTSQYQASSGNQFDLIQTNSLTPTFNLKNKLGSTGSSTLATDNAVVRNVTATTGSIETLESTNITAQVGTIDTITAESVTLVNTNPIISFDTVLAPPRGLIRTLDDAFGLDINVQGGSKFIRLSTNDQPRMSINDETVRVINTTPAVSETTGALVVEGGVGINGDVYIQDCWQFENLKLSFKNLGVEIMTLTPTALSMLIGDITVSTGSINCTAGNINCTAGSISTTAGNITAGRTFGVGGTVTGYIVEATNYLKTNNISLKSAGGLDYDFILPNAMGTSGKALTSGGSGSSTTWTQFIQKLTLNVPSYLTVTGSPVDNVSEGTITIGGATTGTGVLVLNNNPTLVGVTITGVATVTSCNISGNLSVAGTSALSTVTAGSVNCAGLTSTSLNTGTIVGGNATVANLSSTNLTTGTVNAGNVTCLALQSTTLVTGNVTCGAVQAGNLTCLAFQSTNVTTGAVQAGNVTCLGLQSTNLSTGAVQCGNITCAAVESGVITAAGVIVPVGNVTVGVGNINCEVGSITCPVGSVSAGAIGSGCTLDNFGTVTCHKVDCEPYLGIGGLVNGAFIRSNAYVLPAGSGTIVAEGQLSTESTENSTSPSTGALLSFGGLGVELDAYIGGDVHVGDTLYGDGGELNIGDDLRVTATLKCVQEFDVLLDSGGIGQQLYNPVTDSIYHFFDCYYDGTSIQATSIETCGAFYKDQDYLSLIGTTVNIFALSQTLATYWKTNLNDGNTIFNETVNINKTLTVGNAAGQSGVINFKGLTSGTVSLKVPAVAGTYDLILPITAGTAGQVLTSAGGSGAMTWSSAAIGSVTSVAMTVPAFLSVTGSPITSTGTFAVTLSGTALPVLNGGTGTTSSTGTGSVVLSTSPTLVTPTLGVASATSVTASSTVSGTQLISNIAIGTAPLTVTSTTVVPNLNVSQLLGNTWAIPGTIGSTTPNTGAFTTITASSTITGSSTVTGTRLISTIATGTAPLTVTSSTVVANLNVSQLLGGTWAAPGAIGSATPNTGNFSDLYSSTLNGNTSTMFTNDSIYLGPSTSGNTFIDRNRAGGNIVIGYNTAPLTGVSARLQLYNNSSDRTLLLNVISKGSSTGTNSMEIYCPIAISGLTSVTGAITSTSTITGTQLISSIATGTAPLAVTSTTVVPNLNVSQLLGSTWVSPGAIGSTTPSTGNFTDLYSSTLSGSSSTQVTNDTIYLGPSTNGNTFLDRNRAGGNIVIGYNTAPLTGVSARLQLYNNSSDRTLLLNVISKGSSTGTNSMEIYCPIAISGLTSVTGAITSTSTITGTQLISSIATGTAPLAVTSTTVVPNLNVSQLLGGTWTVPGTIGSTTPNTGVFTNLYSATISGTTTTSIANDTIIMGPSTADNTYIDRNRAGGNMVFGYNTAATLGGVSKFQVFNNSTHRELLLDIVSKGTSGGSNSLRVNCPFYIGSSTYPLTYDYNTMSVSLGVDTGSLGTVTITQNICQIVTNGRACTVLVSVEGSFTGGSSWTNLYLMLSSFSFGSAYDQKTPAWVESMPGTNGSQPSYCRWAPNGTTPKLYFINNNSLVSSGSTSGSFKIYSNGTIING